MQSRYESNSEVRRDVSGLQSRIKRAIIAYNARLDADESEREASEGHLDTAAHFVLKPLLDEHLVEGVREFVRIHDFPPGLKACEALFFSLFL